SFLCDLFLSVPCLVDCCFFFFFFFSSRRRHTRCYRDWSSDVCSSDLAISRLRRGGVQQASGDLLRRRVRRGEIARRGTAPLGQRSEERRVGKECRSRGAPYQ